MKSDVHTPNGLISLTEQIAFAEKNLDRLLQWISRVDSKVSVLLGMHTGMLGIVASLAPEPHEWKWFMLLSFVATAVLLGTGFVLISFASYPRTTGPSKSLLFFGSIAGNSFNEFNQCWSSRTTQQHLGDLLEQCHRNSEIIDRKFKYLKNAYRTMMLAMLPWAITLLLFRWYR
jgi:hypothetical protein